MYHIFLYWQNKNEQNTPAYIELCIDKIRSYHENVILIDENTVKNYIDIPNGLFSLPHIAQIADYIRVALLYNYGGIWLDCDCIILKPLTDIFDKLKQYEYIGYQNKIKKIANGFMAAKKNSDFISEILHTLQYKIESQKKIQWTELGQDTITKIYNKYKKTSYIYSKHFFNPIDWRDYLKFFEDIEPKNIISPDTYTVMLPNEEWHRRKHNILYQTKQDILNQNNLLAKLLT